MTSEPTVRVEDLTFSYPPPEPGFPTTAVFSGLALRLDRGESLTVAGGSGRGKSTLCYVLAGLAPRYTGGESEGRVLVAGRDVIANLPGPDGVGLLFQDAATQLFNPTVELEVAWGLETLALPPALIGERVGAALRRFDLEALRERAPWALSGGEQKRVALAALWAMQPRVLLLDEALGGLDPQGRREVRGALDLLRVEGTTLLFTASLLQHADLSPVVALFEEGQLSPALPLATLQDDRAHLSDVGLAFPPETLARLAESHRAVGTEPALEMRALTYAYPEGPGVLESVDLSIPQGQFVALVGRNGAGKSTLLRHFNGLLRPTSGSVSVMGERAAHRAVGELARRVGYLFQRPEQQLFAQTVRAEIAYGPRQLGLSAIEARVEQALHRFDLVEVAERPPAVLGYGTQRSVALAALAALETPVLVLDEPTVGLDGRGWAQLLGWMAERRAAGVTLIVATHEMELAALADRVLVLQEGHIVADGSPAQIVSDFSGAAPA
ncbi:MAG: ABC transporter ATP-binding protein [Anaerolineales bacterium]